MTPATASGAPRPLAALGALGGVFVLGFTIYWVAVPIPTAAPLQGRYGDNAVLAMELARTSAELDVVIGRDPPSASAAETRAQLDALNRADFLYMLAYGTLLAVGFVLLARRRGDRRYLVGVPLVALGVLGDGWENVALLSLTETGVDRIPLLASLRLATHLKWELLAAATALHAWGMWREGGWVRARSTEARRCATWRRAVCAAGSGGATLNAKCSRRIQRSVAVVGLSAVPLGVLLFVEPATFAPLLTLSFVPVWVVIFVRCVRATRHRGRDSHDRTAEPATLREESR